MSPELASAVISLFIAFLGAVAVEFRAWTRRKQDAIDKAAKDEEQRKEAAKVAEKIKADADEATAKLKAEQQQFILDQAKQTTELQTQLNTTREALAAETTRSNGQERLLGELNHAKEINEKEILSLRDAKNRADKEIESLRQDLYHRSQANAETRAENARLLEERSNFIAQISSLSTQIEELKRQIETIKAEQEHQRSQWQLADSAKATNLRNIQFALREVGKVLNDEQKAALDHLLSTKDLTWASLIIPNIPGNDAPPDADERVQQLRYSYDYQQSENRALITLLAEHSVSQPEIDKALRTAAEKWKPPSVAPIASPASAGAVIAQP